MCVMAVVAAAPCQCFSPGGIQTTSPGRICSTGPPQRCARPAPAVTIRVWPSGWVCQAVRAPGSNVTLAPDTRAGSGAWNSGSMRTVPENHSAGPTPEACEPHLLMSICVLYFRWLLTSQSNSRIDLRCAPGRHVARCERDCREKRPGREERERIERFRGNERAPEE